MTNVRETFEAKANKELADRIARLRKAIDEGLESLAGPLRVGPLGGGQGTETDLGPVLRFLEVTRAAGSQKEILRALLDVSSTCYPRTVLFILRSGALVAWDARNLDVGRGAGVESVAHLTIPAGGDHLAARALASGALVMAGVEGPGFLLTEALGGLVPARSAAVPLVVRGRSVALLYGDCGSDSASGSEPVFGMLGPIGSLSIEALGSMRRVRVAGSPRGVADRVAGPQGVNAERPPGPGTASRSDFEGRAIDDHALEADEVASPIGLTVASTRPPAPEEAEMQALLGDIEGMRRGSSDGPLNPDDQRRDADARRFASLLISEILLYNEEAVIMGRRNHDLSRRLAKEIEKSRRAFATRVPVHAGGASRYFDEELLRVLAEGDPAALGN